MFPTRWRGKVALSLVLIASMAAPVTGQPLDAETLRAGLRTANPDEEAYLIYIATLLEQGRLPLDLVQGTFQWARRKPAPKRTQYFKFALNTRAADLGITLPQGTPALRGAIRGRVVIRLLIVTVPVPDASVVLEGASRSTTTNVRGEFAFDNVPFGTFTVRATGLVGLLMRHASARVVLPSTPPSDKPVVVSLELL